MVLVIIAVAFVLALAWRCSSAKALLRRCECGDPGVLKVEIRNWETFAILRYVARHLM